VKILGGDNMSMYSYVQGLKPKTEEAVKNYADDNCRIFLK